MELEGFTNVSIVKKVEAAWDDGFSKVNIGEICLFDIQYPFSSQLGRL